MDKAQSEAHINRLQDPKLKEVALLLHNMKFEYVAGGNDAVIKKSNKTIGQIDLIYKDLDSRKIFIIEVTTEHGSVSPKINSFFSRWSDNHNLKIVRDKFSLPNYLIHRFFFVLSGNDLPPLLGPVVMLVQP